MGIEIIEVFNNGDIKKFIDFPHELNKNEPNYVPETYLGQKNMMNPKKYPFYDYGKVRYFLAQKNGTIVGRIAGIDNPNYHKNFHKKVGFFGFIDFVDDQNVVDALLDKAAEYALSNGYECLMGPTNYTTNETAGTLVYGFNDPPKIMMTYNKPYYGQMLENWGLKKEMDLYAYALYTDKVSEKSIKLAEAIEQRLYNKGITVRSINTKDIDNEAQKIKKIYNSAWDANWGFVPFTDKEFEYLKNDLKMILDPSFAFLAEKEGEPIGFSITLPNINEILIKNKRGRLFPFGIFRLLWGKNKVKTVRILALGVLKDYRKKGIEALFFAKNIQEAQRKGIVMGEASWILENNEPMRKAAENLNGEKYKTYRLYSKILK